MSNYGADAIFDLNHNLTIAASAMCCYVINDVLCCEYSGVVGLQSVVSYEGPLNFFVLTLSLMVTLAGTAQYPWELRQSRYCGYCCQNLGAASQPQYKQDKTQ